MEQCRKFEDELYRFVDNAHRGLWDEIRTKKALDDDLRAKVKARDRGIQGPLRGGAARGSHGACLA